MKIIIAAAMMLVCGYNSFASDCWKTVIPIGTKSQDSQADLFTSQVVAIDKDADSSLKAARQAARAHEDVSSKNVSGTPDTYKVACEGDTKAQKSPSPTRAFIENTLEKALAVLVVGKGIEPKSILLAVIVKEGSVVVMDAYDRDRGDVKKFLEKVGAEVNPKKLEEWIKDPANSFQRSDLGKANEQVKDNFNRSDISKVTGIKF